MNSGTFQKQDIKIIDELYILFDNTEGLYHEASFNTYEKLIEDVKNNIKKDLYNFDSYSNYQILSIYIAITHMIDSKYYTTDINLSRAKILKFHLSKEALDIKKSYSYNLETIFDDESDEEYIFCDGCAKSVCKYGEEPNHRDDWGEAVCVECYGFHCEKDEDDI